jgi:hypothetical protein
MSLAEGQYTSGTQTLPSGRVNTLALDVNGNLKETLGTTIAGEDITNDVLKVESRSLYLNGTTSQLVKTGSGRFFGVVVNSHTSGTLKFWDNTSAVTTILLNTITLASGPQILTMPNGPVQFSTGLFVTVGGTIDYTILYQ